MTDTVGQRPVQGRYGLAACRGAVFGPFWQMKEIALEVKQAVDDYRELKERAQQGAWDKQHKLSYIGLRAWYALPFPVYQVADDTLTYPLYLLVIGPAGQVGAYVLVVLATLALAAAMGLTQRSVERRRAEMIGASVVPDDKDHVTLILDASVNSAPWQVARRANTPRPAGGPVSLVTRSRVLQYSLAYALCNTLLYVFAERLPVNEWVGFGLMLWAAWSVGGAYTSVRAELRSA